MTRLNNNPGADCGREAKGFLLRYFSLEKPKQLTEKLAVMPNYRIPGQTPGEKWW
jgi:hypothetical protein